MSLVVYNAYRYPLQLQQTVHTVAMINCENVTAELVDIAVEKLLPKLEECPSPEWTQTLRQYMSPELPGGVGVSRLSYPERNGETNLFVRSFLFEYHKYMLGYPGTDSIIDTRISWTYLWDINYGYLCLFLPNGVATESMLPGLGGAIEPYSYDGRTCETDHPSEDPTSVKNTWDSLIKNSSIGYSGATAELGGYELLRAFRIY